MSTACSAAAMFAEVDTVMFLVMFTLSVIAPMVVTKATSMTNARSGREYMMIKWWTLVPKNVGFDCYDHRDNVS